MLDVAAAGGWKEIESLRQCYRQADEATGLEVATETTYRHPALPPFDTSDPALAVTQPLLLSERGHRIDPRRPARRRP